MSDDKYPQVAQTSNRLSWYANDVYGTHKVVPADAIVIERGDLPEVTVERTSSGVPYYRLPGDYGFGGTEKPEWYEEHARNYLALAEHLRTNPPVDEAQVEALAALIRAKYDESTASRYPTEDALARHLVARGARVEVEK